MKKRKNKTIIDPLVKDRYSLLPYTRITNSPEGNSSLLADGQRYFPDLELSEERYRFNSTGNPYSAINIFVTCYEYGYYPPLEVLSFISNGFKEHLNSNKPLDSIIGLTKTTKEKYEITKRNINIVLEIDTLRHYFKLNIEDAVYAVARRFEEKGVKLKDTSIADIYHRNGKKEHDSSLQFLHDDIPWLDEMSEEFRNEWEKNFLNRYPNDVKDFIQKKER